MSDELSKLLGEAIREAQATEKDIVNFGEKVKAFLTENPFVSDVETKRATLHQVVNLSVRPNPLRTDAQQKKDVVNLLSLSSEAKAILVALWKTLDEAVQHIAIPASGRAVFPASRGRSGRIEQDRFQREIARFPEGVRELIRQLDPHGGTDGEPLWTLKRIAMGDSKKVLEVTPVANKSVIDQLSGNPGTKISNHWYVTSQRLVLLTQPPRSELDEIFKTIPLNVVFCGIRSRSGQTATQTLTDARELVIDFLRSAADFL